MNAIAKLTVVLTYAISACNSSVEKFDPAKYDKTLFKIQNNLFIKDRNLYSDDFMYQLELGNARDTSNKIVRVIDSVIYYGNDIKQFPNQIPENKQIRLKSVFEDKEYELILKRINKTDLYYEYYINGLKQGLSHRFVTLELYFSLINNFKSKEAPSYNYPLTMYSANIEDSYFHIFVDCQDLNNIKAFITQGVYIIRPMYREVSPLLMQQ